MTKLIDLEELTSPATTDELYIVDDPSGTPLDRRITVGNLLGSTVLKSLFDANTILAADTDDTPAAVTVAEQRLVGRVTDGNITALTAAQVLSILLSSTTAGDVPYFSAANTLARLAIGTAYQTLGVNSGGTAPAWQASSKSTLTTAGDIMYASSANTPARLAIGTANYKLFTNAGGTAPEWAVGIKLVSFTRDLSTAAGDQSITGVGFKGSHAIFLSTIDASTAIANIGLDDGTNQYRLTYSSAAWYGISGTSLMAYISSGVYQSGVISSWDADGFTITWTKSLSPTGTFEVYAIIFR